MQKKMRVANARFDLSGQESIRLFKHYVLYKFLPIGNFGGGGGFKPITAILLATYFGGLLAWARALFEPQIKRCLHFILTRRK